VFVKEAFGKAKQLRSLALAQIKTFGAAKPLDLIFTS
jgi:hypothetical protein